MPTQWAHSLFYGVTSTAVAGPKAAPGTGGIPAWNRTTVIMPSAFGWFQVIWERIRARLFPVPPPTIQRVEVPVEVKVPVEVPVIHRIGWKRRTLWGSADRTYVRTLADRVLPLDAERRAVVDAVVSVLTAEAYDAARGAVRETAQSARFNRPKSWVQYHQIVKQDLKRAENIYRRVKAVELTKAALTSTLSNPICDLAVQLAYTGFVANPPKRTH